MTYARRAITVSFQLGKESFGSGGFDTVKLEGLRVIFQSEWANLEHQPRAVIRIYGMTLDQMNKLTVAGLQWENRDNKVMVEAGDSGGALTTVFNGTINEAYPDFREMPNTAFMVNAMGGSGIQIKPVAPASFEGSVPVDRALGQIITGTGLTLEDNGTNAVLSNPYFPGTVMMQVNRAIRAANVFGVLDTISSVLAIWPKKGSRSGDPVVVSAGTGMIGYPNFEKVFVWVRTVFSTDFGRLAPGKKMEVDTQLTAAKGTWTVIEVDLMLASEMPGGPWEMSIKAQKAI